MTILVHYTSCQPSWDTFTSTSSMHQHGSQLCAGSQASVQWSEEQVHQRLSDSQRNLEANEQRLNTIQEQVVNEHQRNLDLSVRLANEGTKAEAFAAEANRLRQEINVALLRSNAKLLWQNFQYIGYRVLAFTMVFGGLSHAKTCLFPEDFSHSLALSALWQTRKRWYRR